LDGSVVSTSIDRFGQLGDLFSLKRCQCVPITYFLLCVCIATTPQCTDARHLRFSIYHSWSLYVLPGVRYNGIQVVPISCCEDGHLGLELHSLYDINSCLLVIAMAQ
jgi:hypothetical protein